MDDPAPLSNLISAFLHAKTDENWQAFMNELLRARVGVVAHGVPPGIRGQYQATGGELSLAEGVAPNGERFLLACADFPAFRKRYPSQPFNAEIDVVSLFRTVAANPACAGVLLNSAASEHSVPLYRVQVLGVLERIAASSARAPRG